MINKQELKTSKLLIISTYNLLFGIKYVIFEKILPITLEYKITLVCRRRRNFKILFLCKAARGFYAVELTACVVWMEMNELI